MNRNDEYPTKVSIETIQEVAQRPEVRAAVLENSVEVIPGGEAPAIAGISARKENESAPAPGQKRRFG